MKHVTIYTDGACSGNPGPGGWAAILKYGAQERVLTGGAPHTTNNRMELTAAIEALRALKEKCRVSLHTDSNYLVRAFTDGWVKNWQRNGWITASKNPVENRDLWQILIDLNDFHEVKWIKVRGHADDLLNNRADQLAVEALKAYKSS